MLRAFYDTSIVLFGSGCIGYRWAVKLLQLTARRQVESHTDVLLPLEVLELQHSRGQRERGIQISRAVMRLFDRFSEVTEADFLAAEKLHREYPEVGPRLHLRLAVMRRLGIQKICSTYAAQLDRIPGVERSNFVELIRD